MFLFGFFGTSVEFEWLDGIEAHFFALILQLSRTIDKWLNLWILWSFVEKRSILWLWKLLSFSRYCIEFHFSRVFSAFMNHSTFGFKTTISFCKCNHAPKGCKSSNCIENYQIQWKNTNLNWKRTKFECRAINADFQWKTPNSCWICFLNPGNSKILWSGAYRHSMKTNLQAKSMFFCCEFHKLTDHW